MRGRDVLALVALGLLVVVSYLPAMLWGGFVWDDNLCIKTDPVKRQYRVCGKSGFPPVLLKTRATTGLWSIRPSGWITNYGDLIRPAITSSMCCCILANTLLVWHLLRRLAVPGAWMVAAVFAVHPLHVESVAWVIERKDVLSGLFYLRGGAGVDALCGAAEAEGGMRGLWRCMRPVCSVSPSWLRCRCHF